MTSQRIKEKGLSIYRKSDYNETSLAGDSEMKGDLECQ